MYWCLDMSSPRWHSLTLCSLLWQISSAWRWWWVKSLVLNLGIRYELLWELNWPILLNPIFLSEYSSFLHLHGLNYSSGDFWVLCLHFKDTTFPWIPGTALFTQQERNVSQYCGRWWYCPLLVRPNFLLKQAVLEKKEGWRRSLNCTKRKSAASYHLHTGHFSWLEIQQTMLHYWTSRLKKERSASGHCCRTTSLS